MDTASPPPQDSTPLWKLTRQFRLSGTISKALHADLATDDGTLFIGLARFLLALSQPPQGAVSRSRKLAGDLFGDLASQQALARLTSRDQAQQGKTSEPVVSAALVRLFEEARAIRQRTASDEHIGLRHVLLAIATTTDPRLLQERNQIEKVAKHEIFRFKSRIARFCVENLLEDESLKSWLDIFRERDTGRIPNEWLAAAASGDFRARRQKKAIGIATCEPDDPWHRSQQDRAGARREASAFAQMICARRFTPPLAVGVFGNWGSGKSFFMRLLHDQITELSRSSANPPANAMGDFHSNVAQIRFNAWHYVETNLWASIVDHIFTCLDRLAERKESPQVAEQLFDQLDTARRLMVEAAQELMRNRKERAVAIAALTLAQSELAAARDNVRSSVATIAAQVWSEFFTPDTKREIDDAFKQLGFGEAVASASELHTALIDLCNAGHERQIMHAARWRWLGGSAIVVVFAVSTLVAPLALEWIASKAGFALAPFTAVIASIAATASGTMALANRTVRSAADRLRALGKKLDASIAAKTADQQAAKTLAEATVAQAITNEAEADRRLRTVSERADAAARAFNTHNSRSQVLRFVRERVAQGDYARHLSFTATVRKDFEELSRLMAADNAPSASEIADAENARATYAGRIAGLVDAARNDKLLDQKEIESLMKTTEPPPAAVERIVERIVLYIDDLDRCPPEQVVAVLQAIHLLLAFPLFVVFVAVDVRWLRDALVQQYAWRMKDADSGGKTSPADYLEKIFQIPYWVRPIGIDGVRNILKDRFGSAHVDVPDAAHDASTDARAVDSEVMVAPAAIAEPQHPIFSPPEETASTTPSQTSPRHDSSLRLTQAELAVVDKIAGMLGGSPRRVLRFVNVYKIIKSSLDDEHVDEFDANGHIAAATCLAVSIALPERYGRFVDAALALPDDCISPYESLAAGFPELRDAPFRPLETLLENDAGSIGNLRRYAELVERYSFQPR